MATQRSLACALGVAIIIAVVGCKAATPTPPATLTPPSETSIYTVGQQTAIAEGTFVPLADTSITYNQQPLPTVAPSPTPVETGLGVSGADVMTRLAEADKMCCYHFYDAVIIGGRPDVVGTWNGLARIDLIGPASDLDAVFVGAMNYRVAPRATGSSSKSLGWSTPPSRRAIRRGAGGRWTMPIWGSATRRCSPTIVRSTMDCPTPSR